MCPLSPKFQFYFKKVSQKKILWTLRLWVGRRKEPILGYVPKNDEKKIWSNATHHMQSRKTLNRWIKKNCLLLHHSSIIILLPFSIPVYIPIKIFPSSLLKKGQTNPPTISRLIVLFSKSRRFSINRESKQLSLQNDTAKPFTTNLRHSFDNALEKGPPCRNKCNYY